VGYYSRSRASDCATIEIMTERGPFNSIYTHGFVRVATCAPVVEVASPKYNLQETLKLAEEASLHHAALAVFPELGLAAYSNEDLFFQDALLDAVQEDIAELVSASQQLTPVLIVGAPIEANAKLYNCAVVIYRGRILGAVPKIYLPNYREFYEKRQFTSGAEANVPEIRVAGETVPFGSDLIFCAESYPGLSIHVELCEDLWTPIPPSSYAALAGATVLVNLSASNVTVAKADYRRLLCATQSAKCIAAYIYAAASFGESTTDLAWDGHGIVYENGELLAETNRFFTHSQMAIADVDLERLRQDRVRMTSFNDCASLHHDRVAAMRHVPFEFQVPDGEIPLERTIHRFPYVPSDTPSRDERCHEVYDIQVQGLTKRLHATGILKTVIGVSGGLDSTQALIVTVKAMDGLGLPRTNVLGYTMPGFATSGKTRQNALQLMHELGVTAEEVDIRPACRQMLEDLGHPFARGEPCYDVTFENVQAGERTSFLFRAANFHEALVVGTSDLSEIALGYTTYGVGDQMAHYHVNASVPKTLIQYLIRWAAKTDQFGPETSQLLEAIVDTQISPELVPPRGGAGQLAEEEIGPYELQDFNLYYLSRFGYRPSKVAFLSHNAWADKTKGDWPDLLPPERRHEYDLAIICKWLEVFLKRFFEFSQFKRSALPNAPKVGSGGSLSPRSDWRAPSDAKADAWLQELRQNVPH
jgi:NAD+ synthase (glutamine-hydrolysing)